MVAFTVRRKKKKETFEEILERNGFTKLPDRYEYDEDTGQYHHYSVFSSNLTDKEAS